MSVSPEIDSKLRSLAEAVRSDNQAVGLGIAFELLGALLTDVSRIANALEKLAAAKTD